MIKVQAVPSAALKALVLSSTAGSLGAYTINGLGDSRTQLSVYNPSTGSQSATTATDKGSRSFLAHAELLSGGRLSFDMSLGYAGTPQSLLKVLVVDGGSNYTAPTVTFNQGAAGTLQVANGRITGVTLTNPGSGGNSFTATVSDTTGSGAILSVVNAGHGTFGTNGAWTRDMVARLPDVLASPPDICSVLGGYNDVANDVPFETIIANLRTCYETLMQAGIRVIAIAEPGDGGTLTAARRQVLLRVARWTRHYVRRAQAANPLGYRLIQLCDPVPYMVDGTTTAGTLVGGTSNGAGAMTMDGVHFSQLGAQILGFLAWQAALAFTGPAAPAFPRSVSHADSYDSVLNPGGYVTTGNASAAFLGTDITPAAVSGVTITGQTPQGFNLTRVSGSASGSVACSIENPYSDGRKARRPVLAFTLGTGTATEWWSFATGAAAYTAWGAPGGTGNQLLKAADLGGPLFDLFADGEISGAVNVNRLYAYWLDYSSNVKHYAGCWEPANGKVFNSADALPVTRFQLKTQPAPLHANIVNLQLAFFIGFDASGATGSAAATVKLNTMRFGKAGVS